MRQTTDTAVSSTTSGGGDSMEPRSGDAVTVVNLGGGDADSSVKDVQLLQLYNNLWYGQMCTLPKLQDRPAGGQRALSASTPPRPIQCRLPISSPLSIGKSAMSPSVSTTHGIYTSSSAHSLSSDTGLFSPLFTSTPAKIQPAKQSFGPPDLSPFCYVQDTATSMVMSNSLSAERHFVFTTSTHLAVPVYRPHSGLAPTPKGGHQTVLGNCLSPPSYVGKALTHAAERVFTTIASHTLPKPPCTTPRISGPTSLSNVSSSVENKGKTQDSNQRKEVMIPQPRYQVGPRRCLAEEFGQQQLRKHGNHAAKDDGKDDSECSVLPNTPCTNSFPGQHDSCTSPIGEDGPFSVPVVTAVRPSPVFVTSPCLPMRKPKSAPAIPAYLTKSHEDRPYMPSPVYLLSHKQCSAQPHSQLQSSGLSITRPIPGVKPSVRMRATVPQQESSSSYAVRLIPRSSQALTYLSKGTARVEKTGVSPILLSGKPGSFPPHRANKTVVLLSPTGQKKKPFVEGNRPHYNTPRSHSASDKICTPPEIHSSDFDPSVFLVALPAAEMGVRRKEKPGSFISGAPSPRKDLARSLQQSTAENGITMSQLQSHATKDPNPDVPLDILSKYHENMSSYGRKCRGATKLYGFSLAPIPQPEGYHAICPHCGRDLSRGKLQPIPATDPISWYDRNCYICQQNPYKARCYT
ncbi:uncharacterized protein [Branchiostoma lanceolatum]|uniref:uncharacterized protein n=1 Tax=Branchiostoma lanceolatum TaxID=7740 RepID=UPI003452938D